jgi:hypothetical protein|tara:strand:+ start:8433 stop:10184 length:1752 start_codon:yes stop_codon:yes gene_type:complete
MLQDRWSKRDGNRNDVIKPQIINLIASEFLSRELSGLAGASGFLAITAKKAGIIEEESEYHAKFDKAHKEQDISALSKLFEHMPVGDLLGIAGWDRVTIPDEFNYQKSDINLENLDVSTLHSFVKSSDTSVALTVTNSTNSHTMSSGSLDSSKPLAIHSVGKVFTGALMIRMLQEGIISESSLDKPPEFDAAVTEKLPHAVRERLKECTLKDIMMHQSGIGDYLDNYMKALQKEISSSKKEGRSPIFPKIETPADFLQFAEEKIYPLDMVNPISGVKEHYSNIGILLVGMAIQHAYNNQPEVIEPLSYDEILNKFIIGPADVKSFTIHNPGDGVTNADDPVSPFVAGSPAGGYWMTVDDLGKFGAWLVNQADNERFLQLLREHGQEFYDAKRNTIRHSGNIPSASAQLICYLNTGTTVAVLSDKPGQAPNFIPVFEDHCWNDDKDITLTEQKDKSVTSSTLGGSLDQDLLQSPAQPRVIFSVNRAFQPIKSTIDSSTGLNEQIKNDQIIDKLNILIRSEELANIKDDLIQIKGYLAEASNDVKLSDIVDKLDEAGKLKFPEEVRASIKDIAEESLVSKRKFTQ